jgi:hypothetical protein
MQPGGQWYQLQGEGSAATTPLSSLRTPSGSPRNLRHVLSAFFGFGSLPSARIASRTHKTLYTLPVYFEKKVFASQSSQRVRPPWSISYVVTSTSVFSDGGVMVSHF